MSDQPKPATRFLEDRRSRIGYDAIKDAHNAALAAEQGKHLPYISDLEKQLAAEREYAEVRRNEIYEAWKRELADEREKVQRQEHYIKHLEACVENMPKGMGDLTREWLEQKQQLAAYKQKAESMLATSKRVNDQLRQQLTDEREKPSGASWYDEEMRQLRAQVQTLVGLLDDFEGDPAIPEFVKPRIRSRLAKVKEGK